MTRDTCIRPCFAMPAPRAQFARAQVDSACASQTARTSAPAAAPVAALLLTISLALAVAFSATPLRAAKPLRAAMPRDAASACAAQFPPAQPAEIGSADRIPAAPPPQTGASRADLGPKADPSPRLELHAEAERVTGKQGGPGDSGVGHWLMEVPGLDEMAEAAARALEALRRQLAPAMDDLRDAVQGMGDYGAPRMLPNGDILIPRNEPLPTPAPDARPGKPPRQAPQAAPPLSLDL